MLQVVKYVWYSKIKDISGVSFVLRCLIKDILRFLLIMLDASNKRAMVEN